MSDSPLPIPSGYICHTSYAVGKGRQPQQHDCPSSHPPYTATPISPPRANIYWSPSKASFCILFYLSLYLSIPLLLNRSASFPLSLSHFLPSTTSARSFAANLFSVFSLPPLSRSTLFFEKKRDTGWFSLPSRCQDARSCSSRYFLYSRSEGRERRNAMKIHPTTLLFLETSASRGRSGMPRRLHRNSKKSEGVNSICASARLAPNKSNPCATSTIRIRHETFKSIRFGTVDEPLGRYTSEHLPLDWRFRSTIDPKLGYFRIADNLFRRHCFRKLTEEQHLYNIRTIL